MKNGGLKDKDGELRMDNVFRMKDGRWRMLGGECWEEDGP